ncbi:MAG: GtrA family protein [Herbaspirillum sp.]|nr:GtrA family protein [Herbaspirillum sp.]
MNRPGRKQLLADPHRRRTAGEILRYLLAGALNTVLGLSLIAAFMHLAHLSPALSNFLAYAITLFTSFLSHKRFTFRSNGKVSRELTLFILFYWISYLGNLLALSLLLRCPISAFVAQIIASGVFVVISFFLQRMIIFTRRHGDIVAGEKK